MKRTIITLALFASLAASAANIFPDRTKSSSNVIPKDAQDFFNNRRIAVSRDTETIPGYVITTWYRNGKPDTKAPAVVTNKLKKVVGKAQNNPIQNALEESEVDAKKARKVEKAAQKAKKKDTKNYNKWIEDTKKAKAKSSEDMAEFYDSILELAELYD